MLSRDAALTGPGSAGFRVACHDSSPLAASLMAGVTRTRFPASGCREIVPITGGSGSNMIDVDPVDVTVPAESAKR